MFQSTFIVLTGPGGVGKNTIRAGLLQLFPKLITIQKVTTRARREGEGDEFRFVSSKEFSELQKNNQLFEYTTFGGNSYGTPKEPIDDAWQQKKSVIMIYDATGARYVQQHHPDRFAWIFLTASETDLRQRMAARGDPPARIEERLRLAPLAESPKEGEANLTVANPQNHPEQALSAIAEFLKNR